MAVITDWRIMLLASFVLPPPMLCAACIEKPDATAPHTPPKSHVELDTRPIEADASAPRLPAMEASVYCIITEVTCAIIAGILRKNTSWNCSFTVNRVPAFILSSKFPLNIKITMPFYVPAYSPVQA